jgi:flagellin-like protein
MFEDTLSEKRRGQVGIGTLIVFIALVLVAAVAAGVLINTAGELQSRASDTGDDAQAQVSNQIDVVSATGEDITGDSTEDVDTVTLVVKKSPGSDPIDLSQMTVQYTSQDTTKTLTFDSSSATAGNFTTNQVGTGPTEILDDTSERIEIEIDVQAIEGGSGGDGLAKGAQAQIEIVDQSGAKTTYGVNVPEVVTDQFVSV